MMREDLDSRILAALRFRDATIGHVVTSPLHLSADGARFLRNLSGFHVLTEATGFHEYTAAFRDPPNAGPATITLTVIDPSRRYLPRTVTVPLPRDVDPTHRSEDDSIWKPLEVALYPSPTGAIGTGWANLRLSIKRAGSTDGLPFAYVRVVRASDAALLGVGLADHRGEAFVPVAGVPVTSWNTTSASTSPIVTTIAARVTAYYDPSAYDAGTGKYPDPDALEAQLSTLPRSSEEMFDLASGHTEARRIDVSTP